MAILTLLFGREVLETYEICKEKLIIGRAEDCDIEIDNLAVSRHHAIIEKQDGIFTINDLDSNNGTFVNGQRIQESAPLTFGDEIGIGKHVLVFDSHSRKVKPSDAVPANAGAQPDMDLAGRGTMFVEPEMMQKIQKKGTVARKAHLLIKDGVTDNGKIIPLEKGDIVFGKTSDCDVRIKGLFASRRHAILSRLEKGYQVTNLAVLSPTRVNGIKIESAFLCDGDEIAMAGSAFVFHTER